MNYGKYRYEISKKAKNARKNRHLSQVKEIKMRSEISEHDFNFKIKHAEEFLKKGDKVKFTIVFRGREILHRDMGEVLLKRVIDSLINSAAIESPMKSEGNNISLIMTSK